MRKLRWRIRFKTIKNRDAAVYIYQEGYTGNEVTDLEAAEGVITTDEDSDDELMSPVRKQTGYLRVVDNGDVEGLMPSDNMQHYVELEIGGQVEWCGYMQADTFSEEWGVPPVVVEYPLISGLGVLEGCYLDQTKPMRNICLHELMRECLDMAEISYRNVFVPKECQLPGYGAFALSLLEVSRANFFTVNDTENEGGYMKYDAMTALDTLGEVCKFFGWTIHEYQKDLYIVSHGNTCQYGKMAYTDFGRIYQHGKLTDRQTKALDKLKWDGDNHTRDVLQGRKKMKVVANVNPVENTSIEVNEKSLTSEGEMKITYAEGYDMTAIEKIKLYGGGNEMTECEFLQYILTSNQGVTTVTAAEYQADLYYKRYGLCYGEYDLYRKDKEKGKKNYSYKKALIFNLRPQNREVKPSEIRQYPIGRIRSKCDARYNSGAFVIGLTNIRQVIGLTGEIFEGTWGINLVFTFRVGNKYWTGNGWGDSPVIFVVPAPAGDKLEDQKTLDMPYNGVAGYFMPISEGLSGSIELTVYSVEVIDHEVARVYKPERIYIEGLNVRYYAEDNIEWQEGKAKNQYQTSVDSTYRENVNVELMMASYNNNPAGYGLLGWIAGYVGELDYIGIGMMRPERHLLSKLKRIYGRNIEKLTMGVEATGLRPMDGMTYGGKHYDIAYRKMEWEDEHEELTIMDVEYEDKGQ